MEVPQVPARVLKLVLTAKAWATPTCPALIAKSQGYVVGPVPETANPSLPLQSSQIPCTSRVWAVLRPDLNAETPLLAIGQSSAAETVHLMVPSPTP